MGIILIYFVLNSDFSIYWHRWWRYAREISAESVSNKWKWSEKFTDIGSLLRSSIIADSVSSVTLGRRNELQLIFQL